MYLYHYYEKDFGPFRTLTSLPMDEARAVLLAQKAADKPTNPDIDGFLQKRYDRDKQLREMFAAKGGKPIRTAPVYMMLGPHTQWATAYAEPAVVQIPLDAFTRESVSFTYGDSFAALNPALFGAEEY